jgi:hypothetical protein
MLLVQFKNAARRTPRRHPPTKRVSASSTASTRPTRWHSRTPSAARRRPGRAGRQAASTGTPRAYDDRCQRPPAAPLDHDDPAHCYVTGTGLTHLGSADTRDAMHKKIGGDVESLSDSMKMFRMGVEGGKPAAGARGVQPEWFYKGDGSIVRASGEALTCPTFRSTAAKSRKSPACT